MTHQCLLGFFAFSSRCVLPWGRPGTSPPCVQGLLSSFPSHPRRQLMQHRLLSGAEMPPCHLENHCSSQAACSAGLISIGNLLTFVQLYIIDNGKALPRKAQLVVYSGLSVLLCSRCLPHQHLGARAAASHTPHGARAAQGIPNSPPGGAELGMGIGAEPGIGLSFKGCTDKATDIGFQGHPSVSVEFDFSPS